MDSRAGKCHRRTHRVDRFLGSCDVEGKASKQQLGPERGELVRLELQVTSIVEHAPPKRVECRVCTVDTIVEFRDPEELFMRGRENLDSRLSVGNVLQHQDKNKALR